MAFSPRYPRGRTDTITISESDSQQDVAKQLEEIAGSTCIRVSVHGDGMTERQPFENLDWELLRKAFLNGEVKGIRVQKYVSEEDEPPYPYNY